jgi:hypothetical protein
MNDPRHVLPRHLLPAAILLLSLAATAQAEPVVLNHSFESPVYTVAPEYASNNGGTITEWIIHDPTRTGLSQQSGVASNFACGAEPCGSGTRRGDHCKVCTASCAACTSAKFAWPMG